MHNNVCVCVCPSVKSAIKAVPVRMLETTPKGWKYVCVCVCPCVYMCVMEKARD